MANRLVRWFTYGVTFALMPLFMTLVFRQLTGTLTIKALEDSPEVLFFALMVCATSLGEMSELRQKLGSDTVLRVLHSTLLIGASVSAILYGGLVYDKLATGGSPVFQRNLLGVSSVLALVFLVLGTVVQVLLSKIDGEVASE